MGLAKRRSGVGKGPLAGPAGTFGRPGGAGPHLTAGGISAMVRPAGGHGRSERMRSRFSTATTRLVAAAMARIRSQTSGPMGAVSNMVFIAGV